MAVDDPRYGLLDCGFRFVAAPDTTEAYEDRLPGPDPALGRPECES